MFEEYLYHSEELMRTITKEGFKLKCLKFNFARNSIKYLGYIILLYDTLVPMK